MDVSAVKLPKGLKKTKQREDVLQVLLQAGKPLSAHEIYHILCQTADCSYAVSTVYRTLSAFEECGLINRQVLAGNETAVYELAGNGHRHYAICLNCRRMIPLPFCPFEQLSPALSYRKPQGFTVTGHKLELYGYCEACQTTSQPAHSEAGSSEVC